MLISAMYNGFLGSFEFDEREDSIKIMFALFVKKINDATIEYNNAKFSIQPFMATRYVDMSFTQPTYYYETWKNYFIADIKSLLLCSKVKPRRLMRWTGKLSV